jgi:hypothetical protein
MRPQPLPWPLQLQPAKPCKHHGLTFYGVWEPLPACDYFFDLFHWLLTLVLPTHQVPIPEMSDLRIEGRCFRLANTPLLPETPLIVPGLEAPTGISRGDHMDIELVVRCGHWVNVNYLLVYTDLTWIANKFYSKLHMRIYSALPVWDTDLESMRVVYT